MKGYLSRQTCPECGTRLWDFTIGNPIYDPVSRIAICPICDRPPETPARSAAAPQRRETDPMDLSDDDEYTAYRPAYRPEGTRSESHFDHAWFWLLLAASILIGLYAAATGHPIR